MEEKEGEAKWGSDGNGKEEKGSKGEKPVIYAP